MIPNRALGNHNDYKSFRRYNPAKLIETRNGRCRIASSLRKDPALWKFSRLMTPIGVGDDTEKIH